MNKISTSSKVGGSIPPKSNDVVLTLKNHFLCCCSSYTSTRSSFPCICAIYPKYQYVHRDIVPPVPPIILTGNVHPQWDIQNHPFYDIERVSLHPPTLLMSIPTLQSLLNRTKNVIMLKSTASEFISIRVSELY